MSTAVRTRILNRNYTCLQNGTLGIYGLIFLCSALSVFDIKTKHSCVCGW